MEIEIQQGSKYLMKVYDSYFETYVDKITEKAYKFLKESTDGTWFISWVMKDEFNDHHEIKELLETVAVRPPLNSLQEDYFDFKPSISYYLQQGKKICPICNGNKTIPDEKSSAGSILCPKCFGSGEVF